MTPAGTHALTPSQTLLPPALSILSAIFAELRAASGPNLQSLTAAVLDQFWGLPPADAFGVCACVCLCVCVCMCVCVCACVRLA